MESNGDTMRILHAPSNIANQAWYAARALREAGHAAEVWHVGDNPFGFPADRLIPKTDDPRMSWDLLLEAVERFDVFHFHFARSFFPSWHRTPQYWDLPLLAMLGKKIFFTFHGADCAVRSIHEASNPWSYFRFSDLTTDDDLVLKRIEVIRAYANRMFVVSTEYLPFVPDAAWMPRIIDLREWPSQPAEIRPVPRVLHMPSRRGKKGTEIILEGLRALEAEGIRFEQRIVEGVSHDRARAEITAADIVVDNVLTGDYELVSMETMASSRVAVAYLQDSVREAFGGDLPVYEANPSDFVDRMRALIGDRERCLALAARGRAHVARHHDAPVVAARLLEAYAAERPAVPRRSFPDWFGFENRRSVEHLEEKLARLTMERARLARTASELQRRLERMKADPDARRESWKDLVPPNLRSRLRRLRSRLGR